MKKPISRVSPVGVRAVLMFVAVAMAALPPLCAQEAPSLSDAVASLIDQADGLEGFRVVVGQPTYPYSDPELVDALREEVLSQFLTGDTADAEVVVRPGLDAAASTVATLQQEGLLGGSGGRSATHLLSAEAEPYAEGLGLHLALLDITTARVVAASVGVLPWDSAKISRFRGRLTGAQASFDHLYQAFQALVDPMVRANERQSTGGATVITQPAAQSTATNPSLAALVSRWVISMVGGGESAGFQLVMSDGSADMESIRRQEAMRAQAQAGAVVMSTRDPIETIVVASYLVDALSGSVNLTVQPINVREESYLAGRSEYQLALSDLPEFAFGSARSVAIASEPSGARVVVDGAFVGRSPVRLQGLEPGRYGLRLEGIAPYASLDEELVVGEESDVELSFQLPSPRVRVQLIDGATGDPATGVSVRADDVRFAEQRPGVWVTEPLETAVDGQIIVWVESDEYFSESVPVSIDPTQSATIDAQLELTSRSRVDLTVLSEPDGAVVFVDDMFAGTTPLAGYVFDPDEREVSIRLVSSGFETFERDYPVEDLMEQPVSVALAKRVMIRTRPAGAILMMDDQTIGRTDMEILLPARDTEIGVRLGSYTETVVLNALELDRSEVLLEIVPQTRDVALSFRVNVPDPEIWIDGRRVQPDSGRRVTVQAGPREVRVIRSGFAPYTELVSVRQPMTLAVYLLPFEARALMLEADGFVADGKFDRAYEKMEEALETGGASPELTVATMDVCLAAMEEISGRVLAGDQWDQWSQRFQAASEQTRLDLVGVRWLPEILFRVARYNDHLWQRSESAIEFYASAVNTYEAFLTAYRDRALVIGSVQQPEQLVDAHFAIARLNVEAYTDLTGGDRPSVSDVRAAIEAFLYLPFTDVDAEARAQAAQWLGELGAGGRR